MSVESKLKGYIELRRKDDDTFVSRHTRFDKVFESVSKQAPGTYYVHPYFEYQVTNSCPVAPVDPDPVPDPDPIPDPDPVPDPPSDGSLEGLIIRLPQHRQVMPPDYGTWPHPHKNYGPGLTAYSRYSVANCDDTLLMVHGENSTSCRIVNRATDQTIATHEVGEAHDLRWDYTAPDFMFYRDGWYGGMRLWRLNARTGGANVVHDFRDDFPELPANCHLTMGGEGDSCMNSRYWCFAVERITDDGSTWPVLLVFTYDRIKDSIIGVLRPADLGVAQLRKPNMVDMDPDGEWALIHNDRSYPGNHNELAGTVQDGPHFWPLSLDKAKAVRACTSATHCGWARDTAGRTMLVYQESTTDYIEAIYPGDEYKPDGSNQIRLAHHKEFDANYSSGWHIGRAYKTRGFALIGTYSASNSSYGHNQLYFLPLVPDATPYRLGHTHNVFNNYRNEITGAWSFSGELIHFHSNSGNGSGVREVIEVEL